jgi:hypothetical protein
LLAIQRGLALSAMSIRDFALSAMFIAKDGFENATSSCFASSYPGSRLSISCFSRLAFPRTPYVCAQKRNLQLTKNVENTIHRA